MSRDPALRDVAGLFRYLADVDYHDRSPLYERLARQAADDDEILSIMLAAAPNDRLSHLLFAAVQHLLDRPGGALAAFGDEPYATFHDYCVEHRAALEDLVGRRFVQTNEVGRCAALLPCLSEVATVTGRPLAIAEVGTSAGLNLRVDRYHYDYGDLGSVGHPASDVRLAPTVTVLASVPDGSLPTLPTVPDVVWRRGLDRSPIDVTDDDAVRWLRSCIWPEQRRRLELLDAAVRSARSDPPEVVAGDAVADLAALVADAPADAALCVVDSAFLLYVEEPGAFVDRLKVLSRTRPLWWVSGEGAGQVPGLEAPTVAQRAEHVYGVVPLGTDGAPRVLAVADGHATAVTLLG